MSRISFPDVGQPLVSVVVVTYGGLEWLDRTFGALLAHTDPCYEVIIVDNAGPNSAAEWLRSEIHGARLIFNDRNVGFGPAANQGALHAVGRSLCFLNPDAMVQDGWLPPLIRALEEPGVGAAVPRFLNEDGTLQEAGSLVGRDGSTRAFGEGSNPDEPEYRFRRTIDYGSAACFVIPRRTFLAFGGFDPVYRVAYCEDVDLCLLLDEAGLRTVYEPASTVIHARGATSSPEEAANLIESNRVFLLERWRKKLAQRPPLAGVDRYPHRLVAARDGRAADRILVIDDRVPHFDRGSGDPRMMKMLMELQALWPEARVTLLGVDGSEADRYAPPLLEAGIEVVAGLADWECWLTERRFHYSIVIVSRPNNFERFERLLRRTQPQAQIVYDNEAFYFRRMERQREVLGRAAPAGLHEDIDRTREIEFHALRSADTIFCVSEPEAGIARALCPATPTFVLPHIVEGLGEPVGFDRRQGLLFFGGFMAGPGSPNEDALLRLVEEVLPGLWAIAPDLVLDVVGADPTPAVRALESDRIRVVGFVPDPVPWLLRARILIVPLRFGAGIALRLLEAMAAGLPFVTSPVGAEGLRLGDLAPLLVADDPSEAVRQIWSMYSQRDLWERAHRGLLNLAATWYGRDAFRRTLEEAMAGLGLAPPAHGAVRSNAGSPDRAAVT
jgi:GT2 family glycosyltransferase/glycosyltransferase involved in cell wall biosynthesis